MVEAGQGRVLLCRVGARLCGVPLGHVGETMRPLPVDPVKGVPDFVRGLSVVRGVPVPVVDARTLLEGVAMESSAPGLDTAARFITLTLGARTAVLAVDEVLGVRQVASGALADLPPLLAEAGRDVIEAIGMLDAALLLVLRGARLVPDAVWASLDGAGATVIAPAQGEIGG